MVVLIIGISLGIFFIYKSKKTNAKLLYYFGFASIFAGLTWLGRFVAFYAILLTGTNMNNSYGLNGIIGGFWGPLTWIIAIYIGNELMIPEKKELKRVIIFAYVILGFIYEILILSDPMGSFGFVYPSTPGEDLIDVYHVFNSPAGIIYIINLLSILIQWGLGFLIKGFQSKGVIRKKFLVLSSGILIIIIFTILDGVFSFIIIARIGVIISFSIKGKTSLKMKFQSLKKRRFAWYVKAKR